MLTGCRNVIVQICNWIQHGGTKIMSFDVLKSSLSSAIFMYQQLTYSYTLARVDFQLKSIFRPKNSNYFKTSFKWINDWEKIKTDTEKRICTRKGTMNNLQFESYSKVQIKCFFLSDRFKVSLVKWRSVCFNDSSSFISRAPDWSSWLAEVSKKTNCYLRYDSLPNTITRWKQDFV